VELQPAPACRLVGQWLGQIDTMTNASNILTLDYRIVHGDKIYTAIDILHASAYYKQKLYEIFNGNTVGKVVFIWSNELFHIVSILKASWELGCTIFAADYNPGYSQISEFKNFYNFIDVVIGHKEGHIDSSDKIFPNRPHVYIKDPDQHLPAEQYSTSYRLNQPVTGTTPAVVTHTSGTTGFPKLIYFSHQQVIDIANAQVELNGIKYDDIGLHIKTLHHGSLFLNYAMPLLSVCTEHHCIHNQPAGNVSDSSDAPQNFLIEQLKYTVENNITRIMIPYNWIRRLTEIDSVNLKQRVSINTILGPTTDEMKQILNKFNPKNIINMWGCTEVGSVFHSVTNHANLDSYNPNHFDIINKDIDYVINSDHLLIKWKSSTEWNKIADQFVIHLGYLRWAGRTSTLKINGQAISIETLKEFIEKKFNTINFSIVPDFELNCIYLAVFDDTIDIDLVNLEITNQLGPEYKFCQIKKLNYLDLLHGMKPSQPLLLYAFRNYI
jgi:hypothetical protein